jgi:Ca2+-binding EF-hand superfamily protein
MWEKIKNWFGFADLNKDGKVTIEDLEVAKAVAENTFKEANEKINEVVEEAKEVVAEVKTRVNRVKEEVTDVIVAAKEVANQTGDVVTAAKGKARKGRKKK